MEINSLAGKVFFALNSRVFLKKLSPDCHGKTGAEGEDLQ